ncbi:ATP-binding protein [Chloroflexota bacterium]
MNEQWVWAGPFPWRHMLIGAMNPCPCGYYGDPLKEWTWKQHKMTPRPTYTGCAQLSARLPQTESLAGLSSRRFAA